MPMLIGFMIVLAATYQLFFRFERWNSDEKPGQMYEHDNLTGQTRALKPGAKVSVFARILGDGDGGKTIGALGDRSSYLEPIQELNDVDANDRGAGALSRASTETLSDGTSLDLRDSKQVEKLARPVPTPREVVIASSSPPVPMANDYDGAELASTSASAFAVRQVDLNRDGAKEEIIQNAVKHDGLLDISIVKNGQEIFYGRGGQLALLPTRNRAGWADIVLKSAAGKALQVFRYDVKAGAYKAFTDGNG